MPRERTLCHNDWLSLLSQLSVLCTKQWHKQGRALESGCLSVMQRRGLPGQHTSPERRPAPHPGQSMLRAGAALARTLSRLGARSARRRPCCDLAARASCPRAEPLPPLACALRDLGRNADMLARLRRCRRRLCKCSTLAAFPGAACGLAYACMHVTRSAPPKHERVYLVLLLLPSSRSMVLERQQDCAMISAGRVPACKDMADT